MSSLVISADYSQIVTSYRSRGRFIREAVSRLIEPWPDPVLPFDPDGPGTRIYALGTSGSASGREKRQTSSYILERDGYRVLIDAGTGMLMNYPPNRNPMDDIDAIVITHAHPDHAAELDQFAVLDAFCPPGAVALELDGEIPYKKKLLYGPKGHDVTEGIRAYLTQRLNAHHLSPLIIDRVMDKMFDIREWDMPPRDVAPEELVTAPRQREELPNGISMTAIPVLHKSMNGPVPAVGLRFELDQGPNERPLVFAMSGDTVDHQNLDDISRDADLYLADMMGGPVHLGAWQAATRSQEMGVRMLGGVHIPPWSTAVPAEMLQQARERFDGRAEMIMSGTCYVLEEKGAIGPIWINTGQQVTHEEIGAFLQGKEPRQYRPRGIEHRSLPTFHADSKALRRRTSRRDYYLATLLVPRAAERTLNKLAAFQRGDKPIHVERQPRPGYSPSRPIGGSKTQSRGSA